MTESSNESKAGRFLALHRGDSPLLMPNACYDPLAREKRTISRSLRMTMCLLA